MPENRVIKVNAKTSLKDKWSKALGIGALLLSVFCIYIISLQLVNTIILDVFGGYIAFFVSVLLTVLSVQVFGMPLLYGVLRWFWFTTADEDVPLSEVFCFFSSGKEYLRAFSLSFRIFFRSAVVMFFCFLPSLIITIISSPKIYDLFDFSMPNWTSSVWGLGNAFTFFGIIMSFIILLRYFAAPILMINDSTITPHEALDLSVVISLNANGKTFGFILSFAAWFLLSLLFVTTIFTLPYFLASYAVYCRFLINHYNRCIANAYQNPFDTRY